MKRAAVARAVWRAARIKRRYALAQRAALVIHSYTHPMGSRTKAAHRPVWVMLLQDEPDAFHNAVELIARAALVDLLELRQIDLMARPGA